MIGDQLDLWPEEVAALPWGGQSPLLLAQELVRERIRVFIDAACVVDNSVVRCPSREASRIAVNPAQYQLCISTSFKKEF